MATMTPLPQLQPMENPMEQYGRVVALKSMLQQQQMQQQQMAYQQQMQPLQLQQEQQAIQQQALQGKLLQQKVDDDKMLTDMWQKSGGDLDKTWELANAPDSKLSAQGKLGFMQQRYELQKMHNQTSDEEAQLMKHTNEIAGPMLSQMSSASDEELPKQVATYNSTVAANPSLAKYMPPVPQGLDATGTRNWVKNQQAAHTTYEQLDKDRDYNAKYGPLSSDEVANRNAAALLRLKTINPNATLDPSITLTPGKSTRIDADFQDNSVKQMEASAGQRADARFDQLKALDNQGLLPHNSPEYAEMKAIEYRKSIGARVQFNLQNALPPAGTPEQPDPITQALLSGTKWTDVVNPRAPMSTKVEILRRVQAVKPDYNTGDAAVEQAARTAAGKEAVKGVPVIQTALHHLDQMDAANDAYQRGDLKALDDIQKQYGIQIGDTALAKYRGIQQVVMGDILAASSAVGTKNEKEEASVAAITDPANPARANKASIQAVRQLMQDRLKAKGEVYKQATTRGNIFTPQTGGAGAGHYIKIGDKTYQYKGSGDTKDINNYTEVTGGQR
jgi:hypothetical protein